MSVSPPHRAPGGHYTPPAGCALEHARRQRRVDLYRDDKARFPIECLCKDAKQLTGLTDCQARSRATLHWHCHASLSAVTLVKLEARQHNGKAVSAFSMASLKRRACNRQLLERISEP